jgi:chromosome segregation ATPase
LNEGAEPLSEEELAFARRNPHMLGMQDELFFRRLLATIDALRAENERLKGSRDEWAQRSKASSKARNDADDLSRRAVSRAEAAEKRCVELEGRKAEIAALSANRVRTAEAERDAARAALAEARSELQEIAEWKPSFYDQRDNSEAEYLKDKAQDALRTCVAATPALARLEARWKREGMLEAAGIAEAWKAIDSGFVSQKVPGDLAEAIRTAAARLAARSPEADGGGGG